MKVSYVIFARDKAHHAEQLERCVRSAFVQTYGPLEIVLSDQGSTDGTREIFARLAAQYSGPHTVKVLDCPETARVGMAGLNAHLDWLHNTLDCDIFVPSAADDEADPRRAELLVEAFERTGADMVGAAMLFADPAGKAPLARSSFTREGWVTVQDVVEAKVGGSSAPAWRREFWHRVGPAPVLCGCDVWMPPLASVLGGFYYLNTPLYTYFTHADLKNTGLEGVAKALPESERGAIDEHRFFQTAVSWHWVLRRMEALGVGSKEDRAWVKEAAWAHYEVWGDTRTAMTLRGEPPKPFKY